tara:strand:- start:1036 stop:1197 length:162 start_codon:yes stop_codon:yes gene_type:complete
MIEQGCAALDIAKSYKVLEYEEFSGFNERIQQGIRNRAFGTVMLSRPAILTLG